MLNYNEYTFFFFASILDCISPIAKSSSLVVIAYYTVVRWYWFFFPTRPPDPRVFPLYATRPVYPPRFPAYIVIIIIIILIFFCSLSLLSRMNSTRSRRSRIADRRTFFLSFSFSLLTLEQRDHHVSLSNRTCVRAVNFFFSFFPFPFESSPRIGDSRSRDKISNPEFVRSFVRSIDRSIDRSLVAAMANTDELSVVKFSFHYV